MADELKPCPFCGCGTIRKYNAKTSSTSDWYAECQKCLMMTDAYPTLDALRDAWNTRPIEDALRAEIEALLAKRGDDQ